MNLTVESKQCQGQNFESIQSKKVTKILKSVEDVFMLNEHEKVIEKGMVIVKPEASNMCS